MCACVGTRIQGQKCPFRAARGHADIFFKNLFTIDFLEDRSVSVCKVKCLKFQRNARNLDWLSVPVHRTFLRNRHHCTKRSTPLWTAVARVLYFVKARWSDWRKSIGTVINLFTTVVFCWMIQQFVEMCTILTEIPLKWRFRQSF